MNTLSVWVLGGMDGNGWGWHGAEAVDEYGE